MGQKTHPTGFRLGIIKTWSSRWYEEKNYAKWLHEDLKLKDFIKKKLNHAGVVELLLDEVLELQVFMQPLGVVLLLVPPRRPGLDDAEAEAGRMCFLAHGSS